MATMIPYRNPRALLSYYLGFFGFIPFIGIPVAIAALVLGIKGVRFALADPGARGIGHAITGIVLGTVALVDNPIYSFLLAWAFYSGLASFPGR